MNPEQILAHVRQLIAEHAGDDSDKWWYANRYVFARLMLDERKTKTGVKARLFESKPSCHGCSQPFQVRKDVHLHRLDEARAYSDGNCVLMHKDCHEDCHRKGAKKEAAPRDTGEAILMKASKRYDKSFLYWWDISPSLLPIMDRYEAVAFMCKDTGLSSIVPIPELKKYLVPERQTARGAGHWGIKVRHGREDELAFEAGKGGGEWLYLPAVWTDDSQED
jgi:hypothetical protein